MMDRRKSRPGQLLVHVAGCILFLVLPSVMRPGNFSEHPFFSDSRSISEIVAYLLLIGFFYLNFYLLVPRYFFERKYLVYFAAILGSLIVIALLPDMLVPFKPFPHDGFGPKKPPKGNFFLDKTSRHFFIFLAVFFFSLLLRISTRWRQAEKEKLHSELSYLKAQINPHFLFNTLNSIYALAIEKSDDTATAVVKLSNMMRYVLHETIHDFVPLEHELNYIEDYIALQELRFGKTIPLSYQVKGIAAGKKIAPMILMAFIENAFKHGVNAAEDSDIRIDINIQANDLELIVINHIVTIHSTEGKSGMGISNTEKRLQLLYPGKHKLLVTNDENNFSVQLQLQFA